VCDLETSRIGVPYIYIYIYEISNLRVNFLVFTGLLKARRTAAWVLQIFLLHLQYF